jgi:hypothetical protein
MIDRDAVSAERILGASPLETFSYYNGVDTPRSFFAGAIALLRGDNGAARKQLEQARDVFAAGVKETPNVAARIAFFVLTCPLLGDKELAIRE